VPCLGNWLWNTDAKTEQFVLLHVNTRLIEQIVGDRPAVISIPYEAELHFLWFLCAASRTTKLSRPPCQMQWVLTWSSLSLLQLKYTYWFVGNSVCFLGQLSCSKHMHGIAAGYRSPLASEVQTRFLQAVRWEMFSFKGWNAGSR